MHQATEVAMCRVLFSVVMHMLFSVCTYTYMGGCQNYGPFLGTLNIRCRIMIGIQEGTTILTTAHICMCVDRGRKYEYMTLICPYMYTSMHTYMCGHEDVREYSHVCMHVQTWYKVFRLYYVFPSDRSEVRVPWFQCSAIWWMGFKKRDWTLKPQPKPLNPIA